MTGRAPQHDCYEVAEASQVGYARRSAIDLARSAGVDETECGSVGIVVTELATNLLKHAGRGALLVRNLHEAGGGIEVIALDHGPGMADLDRCFGDGFSTRGTAGNGLGAVRRLARVFDAWSDRSGTAILARFGAAAATAPLLGSICIPVHGERRCGDGWSVRRDGATLSVVVVDGLGHGDLAADVADTAVAAFHSGPSADPKAHVERIDAGVRGSRGAAVAVATINPHERTLRYCGVGNIGARIDAGDHSRGLVSGNGIIGAQFRHPQVFDYRYDSGGTLLIMHSDGLRSHWDLGAYPGLRTRHPALIAAVLFRDFTRGRDDATVLVAALDSAAP